MRSEIILNETDPYLREIWAEGYDYCYKDYPMNEMVLVNKTDRIIKRISMTVLGDVVTTCKIITSLLYSREIHRWIKEADGSADRFRELIKS